MEGGGGGNRVEGGGNRVEEGANMVQEGSKVAIYKMQVIQYYTITLEIYF